MKFVTISLSSDIDYQVQWFTKQGLRNFQLPGAMAVISTNLENNGFALYFQNLWFGY